MLIVGVDENGLGPRLGPLVATAVALDASARGYDAARLRRIALRAGIGDSKATSGFGAMANAEGIALAPDGKLIVAEVGARRIIQIDPANGTITEIAANLPIGLPAAPGGLPSNIPTGVGVGATGVIYFSSDIENAIYKVVRK